MTERISPLRRRMIEDMAVRNLSPTTQGSYIHNVRSLAFILRGRPTSWALRKYMPIRFTWCHAGLLGRRSIKSCRRCVSSMA